jgi:hypothetical protein
MPNLQEHPVTGTADHHPQFAALKSGDRIADGVQHVLVGHAMLSRRLSFGVLRVMRNGTTRRT